MRDVKPDLLQALQGLNVNTAVAFPGKELALPLVVVADEAGRVAAQADGQDYLEEYVAAVDIYAKTQGALDALALRADGALAALGFRRTFQQDLFDETAYAWRKRLRYRALLWQDRVYQ